MEHDDGWNSYDLMSPYTGDMDRYFFFTPAIALYTGPNDPKGIFMLGFWNWALVRYFETKTDAQWTFLFLPMFSYRTREKKHYLYLSWLFWNVYLRIW